MDPNHHHLLQALEDEEADSEFWGQDFFAEEEREADWEKSGSEATDVPDSDFDMSVCARVTALAVYVVAEGWALKIAWDGRGNLQTRDSTLVWCASEQGQVFGLTTCKAAAWMVRLTVQPRSGFE